MRRKWYNDKPEIVPGDVLEFDHALHFTLLGDIDKVVVKTVGKLLRFHPYNSANNTADTGYDLSIHRGSWRHLEVKIIGFVPGKNGLSRETLIRQEKAGKAADAAALRLILGNLPFAPEGTVVYTRYGKNYDFHIVKSNGEKLNGYSVSATRDQMLRNGYAFADESLSWLRGVRPDQLRKQANNP